MTLSDEEAVKATKDYFTEWLTKCPEDPKEWVLKHFELFRDPVAKGLDAPGLKDFLDVAIKVDRSTTFCKGLLKEIKAKLQTQATKKMPEASARP
jgi:hypothetical protein